MGVKSSNTWTTQSTADLFDYSKSSGNSWRRTVDELNRAAAAGVRQSLGHRDERDAAALRPAGAAASTLLLLRDPTQLTDNLRGPVPHILLTLILVCLPRPPTARNLSLKASRRKLLNYSMQISGWGPTLPCQKKISCFQEMLTPHTAGKRVPIVQRRRGLRCTTQAWLGNFRRPKYTV